MVSALETYFGAIPWALPVLGLSAIVLALSARPLAARTGWPTGLVIAFGMSLAIFLAVTATPTSALDFSMNGPHAVSWSYHVPSLSELAQIIHPWQVSEPALNAWLAVPLGFAAALAAATGRSARPMLIAIVVPVLAEGVQWAFPEFGRAAFLFGDVTANWTGVAIGGGLGVMVFGTFLRRGSAMESKPAAASARQSDELGLLVGGVLLIAGAGTILLLATTLKAPGMFAASLLLAAIARFLHPRPAILRWLTYGVAIAAAALGCLLLAN